MPVSMGGGAGAGLLHYRGKAKSMRASPQTPANGGQSLPQWITPCYSSVGVGSGWLGSLLDCWFASLLWVWLAGWVCCCAVEGLLKGG